MAPPAVAAGSLLQATLVYRGGVAPTAPAGWAVRVNLEVGDTTPAGGQVGLLIADKIATGSDTSETWPWAGTDVGYGCITGYEHAFAAGVEYDTSASHYSTVATAAGSLAGGLTTSAANCLITAAVGEGRSAIPSAFNATGPAGASGDVDVPTSAVATAWTRRDGYNSTAASDIGLLTVDALKSTAGTTGDMTFTVTATGTSQFAVAAISYREIGGAVSTPVAFSGTVENQAGTEGEAFSFNLSTFFAGNETPFAYSVQAGTLPAGLSLNSSTGVISGTPTTAGVSSGLVIRATDAMLNTADSNTFSITIGAAVVVTPPSFTGPNIGSITTPAGTPETLDISARWSGDLPQTFTAIGTWPSGATVSSDGILQISDIVAVGAYSDLVVRATNSAGFADSNAFTLTIEAITYAASFQTDVMYSFAGLIQANKAVSWTWVPGGRIGDLAGRDVFEGTGTTTAEGRYLVDAVPEGDGLALVTILGETRQGDQVYFEYGTATEEGG